jgi:hypothetical protein
MPTQHTTTTYCWSELSTHAQDKAIEQIRELLAGAWWDESDNEDIAATMLYALADAFQSPGYDTHGEADFPGIEGLKVESWNLDRNEYNLSGCLTPATAPALPWPEKAKQFVFKSHGSGAYVEVEATEGEWVAWEDQIDPPAEFDNAINDAVAKALEAGQTEYDYKTGEEWARQRCEEDTDEFYDDGSLYRS